MPRRGYRNVTLREELFSRLEELRKRYGFSGIPDVIAYLVNVEEMCRACRDLASLRSAVEQLVNTLGSQPQRRSEPQHTKPAEQQRRKPVTLMDVLRERKVQLLSEIRVRNPDRFVERARELGAVVIEGARDTAIVDPVFWSEFRERVRGLPREPSLRGAEEKMFRFLRENALIYFDSSRGWVFVDEDVASFEETYG